jgi:hypothetical protein
MNFLDELTSKHTFLFVGLGSLLYGIERLSVTAMLIVGGLISISLWVLVSWAESMTRK